MWSARGLSGLLGAPNRRMLSLGDDVVPALCGAVSPLGILLTGTVAGEGWIVAEGAIVGRGDGMEVGSEGWVVRWRC